MQWGTSKAHGKYWTNTSKLASHFEYNGINIVSKQSIADEFNNFFVDVGSNLAKMITVADNAASIYDYNYGTAMSQLHVY